MMAGDGSVDSHEETARVAVPSGTCRVHRASYNVLPYPNGIGVV